MRKTGAIAVLALAFAAGCKPPKYVNYSSALNDFTASVPWGWNVIADADEDAFAHINFIGPFHEDFYLGAPSLSVRWYKHFRPHRLPDGGLELYSGIDDFYKQTMRSVYGKDALLYGAGEGGKLDFIDEPQDITLKSSSLPAKFFVVLSPAPASENNLWGVERHEKTGRAVNMRMHAYVLVPLKSGFYVLTYPATRRGYPKFEDRFRALFGSFRPLTEGPGGPKLATRPASTQ